MKAFISSSAYYLPENIIDNPNARLRKKAGIERIHVCNSEMTAGDMAQLAAEKLFSKGVDRASIDFLILCTQSPDYYLPTTACILQDKLNLNKNCGAVDFNLGCSGFIYGLGLAKGLIESGQSENVLLLTSETYSKYINPEDHSTKYLFGDAASAVLISSEEAGTEGISSIVYGTDGSGAGKLIVPIGGSRNRNAELEASRDEFGNIRTNRDLYMDGQGIMRFALNIVPGVLEEVLSKAEITREDINYYVFHQANKLVLDALQEKCGLQSLPYWNNSREYGNTVSSSIPIAITDLLSSHTKEELQNVMLIGFGVGLSWGGCIVDLRRVRV